MQGAEERVHSGAGYKDGGSQLPDSVLALAGHAWYGSDVRAEASFECGPAHSFLYVEEQSRGEDC